MNSPIPDAPDPAWPALEAFLGSVRRLTHAQSEDIRLGLMGLRRLELSDERGAQHRAAFWHAVIGLLTIIDTKDRAHG